MRAALDQVQHSLAEGNLLIGMVIEHGGQIVADSHYCKKC